MRVLFESELFGGGTQRAKHLCRIQCVARVYGIKCVFGVAQCGQLFFVDALDVVFVSAQFGRQNVSRGRGGRAILAFFEQIGRFLRAS